MVHGLGCLLEGEEPGDLAVDQLSYTLWPAESSIETHCRIYWNASGYKPDTWALTIRGWVAYGSPQGGGRITNSTSLNLDKDEAETISLCFHLPVQIGELTSATYGFSWSADDDWKGPWTINATIDLSQEPSEESPETPPEEQPSECAAILYPDSGIWKVQITYLVNNPSGQTTDYVTQPYVRYWKGDHMTEILVDESRLLGSLSAGPNVSIVRVHGGEMGMTHTITLEGIDMVGITRLVAGIRAPVALPEWVTTKFPGIAVLDTTCEYVLIPRG